MPNVPNPIRKKATRHAHILISVILYAALPMLLCPPRSFAQGEKCGAGIDLVGHALEQIKIGTQDETENGIQLLKEATQACPTLGDAWYYRSVFETKLGHTNLAKYALEQAKTFGSQAMDQGATPFILAAPPQPQFTKSADLPPIQQKWALAIGISQFSDANLNLQYTSKDAKDFSSLLADPTYGRFKPENIHTLTGQVTTRQIKEELNWLARMAGEDDLVVIFLASHGTARDLDTADVNYVVTSDTELTPQDSLFATALRMVDLSDIVRSRIKARRTVLILDTCHSGAATVATRERALGVAEASLSQGALERMQQGIGRAILTSSKEGESSYEGPPYQNGYFTHFLLEAIRQNGGSSNMQQIYAYVRDGVTKAVATRASARGVKLASPGAGAASVSAATTQTPVLDTSQFGSDIVLGMKADTAMDGEPGQNFDAQARTENPRNENDLLPR